MIHRAKTHKEPHPRRQKMQKSPGRDTGETLEDRTFSKNGKIYPRNLDPGPKSRAKDWHRLDLGPRIFLVHFFPFFHVFSVLFFWCFSSLFFDDFSAKKTSA